MTDVTYSLLLRVTGRVQGVWYRGWTEGEARARGLDGWVKNEPDGSVSALLSGPEGAVREMVETMHQGPPAARVDAIVTEPAEPPPESGFRIRR